MHTFCKIFLSLCIIAINPLLAFADTLSTKVNAGSMQYLAKENRIKFSKNVFVERDNFYLWADTIIVHLAEGTNINAHNMQGIKESDIKKIEAIGKVCMEYGNSRGFSGNALFDISTNTFSMKDSPLFEEGDSFIKGDEIIYYIDEQRSEIIGDTNRVKATLSGSLQVTEDNATLTESKD